MGHWKMDNFIASGGDSTHLAFVYGATAGFKDDKLYIYESGETFKKKEIMAKWGSAKGTMSIHKSGDLAANTDNTIYNTPWWPFDLGGPWKIRELTDIVMHLECTYYGQTYRMEFHKE